MHVHLNKCHYHIHIIKAGTVVLDNEYVYQAIMRSFLYVFRPLLVTSQWSDIDSLPVSSNHT